MTSILTNNSSNFLRSGHAKALLLAVACIALLIVVFYQTEKIKPEIPAKVASNHIRAWLEDPPVFSNESGTNSGNLTRLYHLTELKKLYRSNRNQLIWFNHYDLSDEALLLIQSLRETVADDRYMYSYHLPAILNAVKRLGNRPDDVTALDLLLSEAYITFAQDSLNNDFLPDLNAHDHIPKQQLQEVSQIQRRTTDEIIYQLQQNLDPESLVKLIRSMTPSHKGYLKLRTALEFYQNLAQSGQWQIFPEGPNLYKGDQHEQVILLRKLLLVLGDKGFVEQDATLNWQNSSDVFDDGLKQVLQFYQSRNGLKITGDLDQITRQQLQESPNRISRRIAFNMKRWRHLPEKLGAQHILINMAAFNLQYINNQVPLLDMKVIVGRPDKRTPTLIENMGSIVINPAWTIPMGIAAKHILPRVQKDISYLEEMDLELYYINNGRSVIVNPESVNWNDLDANDLPFWFRQRSGVDNALGQVKFILPNTLSIYLHDTNHPELFDETNRALSSGCVRLENPVALANLLINEKENWDQKRIDSAFNSGRTYNIKLENEVPVYLLYMTSWVDDSGVLHQRPDIYNWDQLDTIGSDILSANLASDLIDILSP